MFQVTNSSQQESPKLLEFVYYWQNILQADSINHGLSITGGHQHVDEEFYVVVGVVGTFWMTQSSCEPQYKGARWAGQMGAE